MCVESAGFIEKDTNLEPRNKTKVVHIFCKELLHKKLVLRWPKFQETLVLCLRSIKILFKVKSMILWQVDR